jgi:quercetin dioxygenase-like cupin family protein
VVFLYNIKLSNQLECYLRFQFYSFMKPLLFSALVLITSHACAQKTGNLPARQPEKPVESIHVEKIADDSLCTTFLIWIQTGVKQHFHSSHTENIYIIEGSGEMELDGQIFTVKAGDYILVPTGKVHAVTATAPMKVLSIQTPRWVMDDRKFVTLGKKPHNEMP